MTPAHRMPIPRALVWFRRDLRLDDQAALYHALRAASQVWCVFVLDTEILEPLRHACGGSDRRVDFIIDSLRTLDEDLQRVSQGRARLLVRTGSARQEIPQLATALGVQAVFANHDYEPDAITRDQAVLGALAQRGIALHTFKDQVVFEQLEVLSQANQPYGVYTPYKNMWLKKIDGRHGDFYLSSYPCSRYWQQLAPCPAEEPPLMPSGEAIGFHPSGYQGLGIQPGSRSARVLLEDFLLRIDHYDRTRDFPAIKGPSYLSMHLRFGTVSVRELARMAYTRHKAGSHGASVWLSELIWRDFYFQILANFPHVAHQSFKPAYDRIVWEKGPRADAHFKAWCQGETGYPLVDAAMHQLNQTGYMHNRLRMVTASFLVKDLGIDWRRGEQYFALKLNDFDLAANNGGWQWASSSGCDAQPWFRIFNPVSQSEKFDPSGKFIRRYLPQLAGLDDRHIHAPWLTDPVSLAGAGVQIGKTYPPTLVDHAAARLKTLQRYSVVKQ
jgi:deoxyribodipyrimidine photo-lyase